MEDQWISVEDRLPDYEVKVLVFGVSTNPQPQMGGIKPSIQITARFDPTGTAIEYYKDRARHRLLDKNNFRLIDVTHWMPLPQPPNTKTPKQ